MPFDSRIADKLIPLAAKATVSIGGSYEIAEQDRRMEEILAAWKLLHPQGAPPASADGSPPPPEQFGPFNWSPIVFGGGVPVGGWAQLTLFRNGAVNFTGHFHDSGTPSYDIACVFAVRASDGTVYTFSHNGRCHGTFEAGSRDFDWGDTPSGTAVAAGWNNLMNGLSWHASASANGDIGALLESAVKAVGEAAKVIAII